MEGADKAFAGLPPELMKGGHEGKVRQILDLGEELLLVTTDRISAFDRILGLLPGKGAMLQAITTHWLESTRDIMENHLLEVLGPHTMRVRKAQVLPVEIIVRGYLCGSAWRDYQAGTGAAGRELPRGMKANQVLDAPWITPSTKAELGEHDEAISPREILERGLVAPQVWAQVEEKALALFRRGQEEAARRGLILVDTKYEMGLLDGRLILVDEIHTPDSSRYWYAQGYEEAFAQGASPRLLDKEYLRQQLLAQGFSGEGEIPHLSETVWTATQERYREIHKALLGREFDFSALDNEAEVRRVALVLQKDR